MFEILITWPTWSLALAILLTRQGTTFGWSLEDSDTFGVVELAHFLTVNKSETWRTVTGEEEATSTL